MLILNPAARPTTMPQNKSRNPPQSHNVACIHAACMRDGAADIGHGQNMRVMRASDHQIRRAAVIATGLFARLMSRKTLGILDGGRGGGVDRSWRRRGVKGVDKGGA